MPEGHSVHRIARQLNELFAGQHLQVSSPQGRFREGASRLNGQRMLAARAIGKQLFVTFSGGEMLRVHLGLYGAWDFILANDAFETPVDGHGEDSRRSIGAPRRTRLRIGETSSHEFAEAGFPPEPIGQVRVRLLGDDALADLRGPTACEVLSVHEALAIQQRLGPDPADEAQADGLERFRERIRGRKMAIGLALMNQSIVSGIGNVYRAELLFRAKIDPHTPCNELSDEQIDNLWHDWAKLLQSGIEIGQMVTMDGLTGSELTKALRNRADRHWVYKREGLPCRVCSTTVALELMATRKLYWCPNCQR